MTPKESFKSNKIIPLTMLTLLLTRHGETTHNRDSLIQGSLDTALTSRGEDQAHALARYLRNVRVDAIYSSDLTRAVDTAQIILSGRGDIGLTTTDLIRERDFGRFTGEKYDTIDTDGASLAHYLFYKQDICDGTNPHITPKDGMPGETTEQVMLRTSAFYNLLLSKFENASILVVGHGFYNPYLLNNIFGIPLDQLVYFQQDNACVNQLRVHPTMPGNTHRHVEVEVLNFMEHVHRTD